MFKFLSKLRDKLTGKIQYDGFVYDPEYIDRMSARATFEKVLPPLIRKSRNDWKLIRKVRNENKSNKNS